MKLYFNLFFLYFFILFGTNTQSQNFYVPENIKSVLLLKNGSNVQNINLGESFELSFDDLNANEEYYYYQINHYDYNWEPTKMRKSDYLDGFDDNRIRNVKNSFNTLKAYTHYSIKIPNNDVKIKVSGNYSISIHYSNGGKIFEKYFSVIENLFKIQITINRSNSIENIDSVHKLKLKINCNDCSEIFNNSSELKIIILKNKNWNSKQTLGKPKFTFSNSLIYDDIIFDAGNEFLNFDNSKIKSTNYRISKLLLKEIYNTFLVTDFERTNQIYEYSPDINGEFNINSSNYDHNIENDYSKVHFKFKPNLADEKIDVFLIGKFNDFSKNPDYKLVFDTNKEVYEGSFLFKQGFYDYKYGYINSQDNSELEFYGGNFWQTENIYQVTIFHKKVSDKFFKIIGQNSLSSLKINN